MYPWPTRRAAPDRWPELAGRVLAADVLVRPMGDVHAMRGAIRDA